MAMPTHALDDFREILQEGEPLARHTWFRLGGPAEFFARPRRIEELGALISRCREAEIPLRVLGGGSNILVAESGVAGVVVHLENPHFSEIRLVESDRIIAEAAVPLTPLISHAARAGLAGLEVLTGIPGTVGGAIVGNSGSRQNAIGQFVRQVTVIDDAGEVQVGDRDDLEFTYRGSNIKDPVVVAAEFTLEPEDPESVVRRMRRIWIGKKENQPYGHQSTSCIFKSPTPDMSAAVLLEEAGVIGMRVGSAEISERHANYIVAQPGSTVDDILALIDQVRDRVAQQLGLELDLQLQIWS